MLHDTRRQFKSCPACKEHIQGIYLYPLDTKILEEASERNQNSVKSDCDPPDKQQNKGKNSINNCSSTDDKDKGRKRDFDAIASPSPEPSSESAALVTAAASPFLVYSKSSACSISIVENDKLHFRTGRWTKNELGYVECLVQNFDQGAINLPEGIRTNEFLRDLLMCKSSRLTKKYKNAKLSTHLYQADKLSGRSQVAGNIELSKIQHLFLKGVSEVTGLILRFNLNRIWRQHLFDVSLQVGYGDMNAQDWLKSLDELDRLVADAEEQVRLVRRRRMKMAFKHNQSNPSIDYKGVFLRGPPGNTAQSQARPSTVVIDEVVSMERLLEEHSAKQVKAPSQKLIPPNPVVQSQASAFDIPDLPFLPAWSEPQNFEDSASLGPLTTASPGPNFEPIVDTIDVSPIPSEIDYSSLAQFDWDDLRINYLDVVDGDGDGDNDTGSSDNCSVSSSDSYSFTFLHELITNVRKKQLPFHYIDMWIPSQVVDKDDKTDKIYLTHNGDAIRSDLSPSGQLQLKEFGLFSRNFVFSVGAGMPGRVYESSRYSWERNVQSASPDYFRRVGGARLSNICTVVGIPVHHSKLGLIVIGLYSLIDLVEDPLMFKSLMDDCNGMAVIDDIPVPGEIGNSHSVDCAQPPSDNSEAEEGPDIKSSNSVANVSMSASISDELGNEEYFCPNEVNTLVNLLSIHIPVNESSSSSVAAELSDPLQNYISLRLLLLRLPSGCAENEKDLLKVLKKSWHAYVNAKMQDADIAKMLVKDWMCLKKMESDESKHPWGQSMSHVDYSSPRQTNTTSVVQSTVELTEEQQFQLPPPAILSDPRETVASTYEYGSVDSPDFPQEDMLNENETSFPAQQNFW